MTTPRFDRWFIACDPDGHHCIWLAIGDTDPYPTCFAWMNEATGVIWTDTAWPLSSDELGDALNSLHAGWTQRRAKRISANVTRLHREEVTP